jgi:hypothetical protein
MYADEDGIVPSVPLGTISQGMLRDACAQQRGLPVLDEVDDVQVGGV